ncbi:hypothetical protein BG844_18120 [Couchioplanes caeruleus subsp. caeruleus]|uniref:Uncharacterized protein n=1 Tax=Couchioplanes caeruleus subsp. caeruleus TaxID=56427 RepID=A0A1K0GP77_9ACTN|nr:hypothetical protein BG844_18120 [Couchioplanes caeruleus subsp. caeruleus]
MLLLCKLGVGVDDDFAAARPVAEREDGGQSGGKVVVVVRPAWWELAELDAVGARGELGAGVFDAPLQLTIDHLYADGGAVFQFRYLRAYLAHPDVFIGGPVQESE